MTAPALQRQFEHASASSADWRGDSLQGCAEPWSQYCESEARAIDFAIGRGKRVLVVGQPQMMVAATRDRHRQQQQALATMLQRKYGSNRSVEYLAIGRAVDLEDTDLTFDQMHLNAQGNARVAALLVDPVVRLSPAP
jgi:hypothetical protein